MKEKIQKNTARWGLKTAVLMLFFSVFTFVFLPYLLSDANAVTEVSLGTEWTPISLTFDTGGDVDFGTVTPSNVDGDAIGTMKLTKKTVAITSNAKSANIYLSMAGSDSNLNHSYGSSGSSVSIPAMSGTWASPAEFTTSSWGYAIPEKTYSGNVIYDTNFDTPATYTAYNTAITNDAQITYTGDYSTIYNTGTWAGVPAVGHQDKIWHTDNPGGFSGASDTSGRSTFDIYYAVMVDETKLAGTYSNSVVYTALASANSTDAVSTNIEVTNTSSNGVSAATKRFVAKDDILELRFDIAASQEGLVASDNVKAYIVPHSTVLTANYQDNSAVENAKVACPIQSFSISSGGAIATCKLPSRTLVSATSGATENSEGYYDVLVQVTLPGSDTVALNYISQYKDGDGNKLGTIAYVGLQSFNSDSGYVVENMQDMTTSVCKNTNMWGTGGGSLARVYDYTGTGEPLSSTYGSTAGSMNYVEGRNANTGTFRLKDSRDNHYYLVRRLADGNCWMVQNLDLDLAKAGQSASSGGYTMTNKNTDITAATYTPTAYGTAALSTKIGSAQDGCTQFLAHASSSTIGNITSDGTGNRTTGNSCYWGSNLNDSGAQITSGSNTTTSKGTTVYIENNSRAEVPRQYENGWDYINNSDPSVNGASGNYTYSSASSNPFSSSSFYSMTSRNSDGTTSTISENAETQLMGNWYNWYAATAETGTWSMSSGNASGSICPKGWGLPENSGTQSWDNLLTTAYSIANSSAGSQKMRSVPLSIIFSGSFYWVNGGLYGRGTDGSYWSSTPYASTNSRRLVFNSTYVNPQGGYNKSYGFTVRCVAR